LTDLHFGVEDPGTDDLAGYVNTLGLDAVLILGDNTSTATEAQMQAFSAFVDLLTPPAYIIPGSHDEGDGLDPGGNMPGEVADYTYYDQYVGAHHFAVTLGDLRFIGFETPVIRAPDTPTPNWAAVPAGELAYVTAELEALAGKTPVLCTHYPLANIDPDHGKTELLALCSTHSVNAIFGGHIHVFNVAAGTPKNITAPTGSTADGGFLICEVYGSRILIRQRHARAPFAEYGVMPVLIEA
jgi:3',5'-cyclic AMP phosphodiesterase CpdA